MKKDIFFIAPSSIKLNENFTKQFGGKINLEKYTREQLEDIRNKIRTRVFQQEGSAGYNDLLTNETYQKDKAMLQLLNTRIKEMLGEDIKKLRDKMVELSEAKKTDRTGDGKSNFDDVQVARMVAGGVPRKKAIAKATGDKYKEGRIVKGKGYDDPDKSDKPLSGTVPDNPWHDSRPANFLARQVAGSDKNRKIAGKAQSAPQPKNTIDKDIEESDAKCNHTPKGKKCPVHGLKECGTMEAKEKPSAGMTKKEKSAVVKKAKAGGDIGKPGKGFEKVEKAAKKGGARDPKAVAAAAMWKQQAKESISQFRANVRLVNESLAYYIAEDEEGKAKAITAASDIVNDFTSWMQRVGQYQTKAIIELADAIRADFGLQQAETFKQSVAPALATTLETLTQQREAISNAVAVLAGEEIPPDEQMGAGDSEMGPAEPDTMNAGDEFAAADAAAGGSETSGREMRESRFARRLSESHNIIAKLAK